MKAAAQPSLSAAQQERLAQLSHAGGERTLTEAEKRELDYLLDRYDRAVLRRARALAILTQRGYDIDVIGQWPVPANGE